jgi:hypothetical protein
MLLIDNLLHLKLIEEEPPKLKDKTENIYLYQADEEVPEIEIINSNCFRLSKFGKEFLNQITK